MQSLPPEQPTRVKLPGPGVSIVLLLVLALLAAVSWMLAEKIAPAIFIPAWKTSFQKGEKLADTDPQAAIECMLEAVKEAQSTQVDALSLADIYSQLGVLYIGQGNRQAAESYIMRAIAAAEAEKKYAKVSEFYQNASWAEHCQYWRDHSWRPNIEYQKNAMAAASKAWGEKCSQNCLWTMGQIYMDLGQLKKAQACIDKACHSLASKHEKSTAYDYNCLSRLYAYQHKWNKSLDAYLKARAANTANKENLKLTDDGFAKYLDDANPEKSKYDFDIAPQLLQEKDFDKLDAMANKLRASQTVLPDGHWQLDKFYDALLYLYDTDSDARWQAYLNNLSAWVAQKPQSVTAKVALADAYVRYAWKARSSAYADNVSTNGWDLMAERLKKAEAQARADEKLPTKCPHLYHVLANVALGQQWSREDYNKMVAKCELDFPNYLPIYMSKAYYLQPRWNGISGESDEFITGLADKAGGENGDIVYAQMIWDLDNLDIFDNIFSDNAVLDWPRARRGLLALIKRYPHDAVIRKELIALSLQADDEKTVKQAFSTPL